MDLIVGAYFYANLQMASRSVLNLRRTSHSMDLSTVSDCAAYMVLIAFSVCVSTGVSHCLYCICDVAFSHFRPSLIITFPLYIGGLVG